MIAEGLNDLCLLTSGTLKFMDTSLEGVLGSFPVNEIMERVSFEFDEVKDYSPILTSSASSSTSSIGMLFLLSSKNGVG